MNQRIKELDGIRGIAILLVLVWHYYTCLPKHATPINEILQIATKSFWSGVDLFFVLSGFLIGKIIIDKKDSPNFFKVFWIRRSCRILPVYMLVVTIAFLCQKTLPSSFGLLFDSAIPWWSYYTFTQNIVMGLENTFGGKFLGISWSIAVEEQFYLLCPILLILCPSKNRIQILILFILGAIALRSHSDLIIGGDAQKIRYTWMPFRMDSLFMGVLIADIYSKKHLWCTLKKYRWYVLGVLIINPLIKDSIAAYSPWQDKFIWFTWTYGLLLLTTLLFQDSKITKPLRTKFLSFFGGISYGLYMYHEAILGLLHAGIRGRQPHLGNQESVTVTVIATLLSILLAYLSLKFFEKPFWKIGHKSNYKHPKIK